MDKSLQDVVGVLRYSHRYREYGIRKFFDLERDSVLESVKYCQAKEKSAAGRVR